MSKSNKDSFQNPLNSNFLRALNDVNSSTISGGTSVSTTDDEIVSNTDNPELPDSTGGYTTGFILVKQSGATD